MWKIRSIELCIWISEIWFSSRKQMSRKNSFCQCDQEDNTSCLVKSNLLLSRAAGGKLFSVWLFFRLSRLQVVQIERRDSFDGKRSNFQYLNIPIFHNISIQLLEYSKTSPSSPSPPSRSGDPPSKSGTESRIIDPLVAKRPGKKNLK